MTTIGGTDAPALIAWGFPDSCAHLAKYGNISDLYWKIKKGIRQKSSSVMERGIHVEPRLREVYVATIGPVLPRDYAVPLVVNHPFWSWAKCSPDDLTDETVIDYKSVGQWGAKSWARGLPETIEAQLRWNMGVTNRPHAHVLAGFGVDDPDDPAAFVVHETRHFELFRDTDIEAQMFEIGARFVAEHLEPEIPPSMAPVFNKREIKKLIKEMSNGA